MLSAPGLLLASTDRNCAHSLPSTVIGDGGTSRIVNMPPTALPRSASVNIACSIRRQSAMLPASSALIAPSPANST